MRCRTRWLPVQMPEAECRGWAGNGLCLPLFGKGNETVPELQDSFGRNFEYLRLSVTEACNFKCLYCLPDGYKKPAGLAEALSVSEIRRLVSAFAALGFWKVRLTGGEPTTRRDLLSVVESVSRVPGIRRVGISTNGHRLNERVTDFRTAGITALNVSLDSLDPERFFSITGSREHDSIIRGLDRAIHLGFESIKVNAVLLKGINEPDLESFEEWVRERPISVRWIELMRTGRNTDLYRDRYLSGGEVRLRLLSRGWKMKSRESGDGPAWEFVHPKFVGRIGIIAPYSKDFCATCNRLRVSSQGKLRLCLFGEEDYSLRPWLKEDEQQEELIWKIQTLIDRKPQSHRLHEENYGNTWNLSSIGG